LVYETLISMTLDQIINLFERIEKGEEGQVLGFHLHQPIRMLQEFRYGYDDKRFSDFLKALKEHEPV